MAGAISITAGLMVLVYAITRTSAHGWSDGLTVALLATAAALIAAFVGIDARSPAPLLPLRIFRLRTLTAANVAMLLVGATAFSQFFLITLYLQEVLDYSAIETGVAFIAITVTIIAFSNVGQGLTTRLGPRPVLSDGLLLTAAGGAFYARMPAGGHYFWDVFPGLILSGIGLALSFVPVTIASLTGVKPADAGVASGLVNTSRQIGGSVGLAAVTTTPRLQQQRYFSARGCPPDAGDGAVRARRRRSSRLVESKPSRRDAGEGVVLALDDQRRDVDRSIEGGHMKTAATSRSRASAPA